MIPARLGRYEGHRVWSADNKVLRQVHAYVGVYNSLAQALKQLTSCCPVMALHCIALHKLSAVAQPYYRAVVVHIQLLVYTAAY